MERPGFHILDHPSDVGVEAEGKTMVEAFEYAAYGMMSLMIEPGLVDKSEEREVRIEASDPGNLLVKWLSEILFLYDGQHFLPAEVSISRMDTRSLSAVIRGERLDRSKHRLTLDVKAVTYHQLAVEQHSDGCRLRVYFDV